MLASGYVRMVGEEVYTLLILRTHRQYKINVLIGFFRLFSIKKRIFFLKKGIKLIMESLINKRNYLLFVASLEIIVDEPSQGLKNPWEG